MAPVFLGLDEVIEIHWDMIERYGGSPGIRDMGLLQSAVAMPQAGCGPSSNKRGTSPELSYTAQASANGR